MARDLERYHEHVTEVLIIDPNMSIGGTPIFDLLPHALERVLSIQKADALRISTMFKGFLESPIIKEKDRSTEAREQFIASLPTDEEKAFYRSNLLMIDNLHPVMKQIDLLIRERGFANEEIASFHEKIWEKYFLPRSVEQKSRYGGLSEAQKMNAIWNIMQEVLTMSEVIVMESKKGA